MGVADVVAGRATDLNYDEIQTNWGFPAVPSEAPVSCSSLHTAGRRLAPENYSAALSCSSLANSLASWSLGVDMSKKFDQLNCSSFEIDPTNLLLSIQLRIFSLIIN